MRRKHYFKFLIFLSILLVSGFTMIEDWGFYSHRQINRMAVFTLPSDLMGFYKSNIEYITEHAVDPDKRRYATKYEAIRHYIDLDQWGRWPYQNVPREWDDALSLHAQVKCVKPNGDTTVLQSGQDYFENGTMMLGEIPHAWKDLVKENLVDKFYDEEKAIECPALDESKVPINCGDCVKVFIEEHFSEHGIVPYYLVMIQQQLTKAFENRDVKRILQLSADIGHYIGDAHVPLHTTKNYNGQLTDQVGIHAFWETRIPELFAIDEYDFLVGQSEYIDDPKTYYWDVVLESNYYVGQVLSIEKGLSESFPSDQQYCFEERLELSVRTQCTEYARAYQEEMNGMVENRMRAAILSIGSAWYTAWVDAGQPDMDMDLLVEYTEKDRKASEELDKQYKGGKILGRTHPN